MKIGSYCEAVELRREGKVIHAKFLRPHRALSTCRFDGGPREDIDYLFNDQSCEPSNQIGTDLRQVAVREPERYQKRIGGKVDMPYARSAGLGTAARMNNAAIARETYQDLEVIAITTAGVGGNGGRAVDPASYRQTQS